MLYNILKYSNRNYLLISNLYNYSYIDLNIIKNNKINRKNNYKTNPELCRYPHNRWRSEGRTSVLQSVKTWCRGHNGVYVKD